MRTTAAQVAIQGFTDDPLSRMVKFSQEGSSGDDHAIGAEAALSSLILDKRLLDWVQLPILYQTFQGDYGGLPDIGDGHLTGLFGLATENDHAGAALFQAAAKLRTVQTQLITQHIQQGSIGRRLDGVRLPIYVNHHLIWHM